MAYCGDHHTLVTASADMTLLQWYLDDIPAIKHFTLKSRWPTKHAAMSMCWSSSHRLLYSGTTAGTIQGDCTTVISLSRKRRVGAGRGARRCTDCDPNRREATELNCARKSRDFFRDVGMGCGVQVFTSGNICYFARVQRLSRHTQDEVVEKKPDPCSSQSVCGISITQKISTF